VANWADQAKWVVKASHWLVLFGTETPRVATPSKVLWARRMEVMVNLGFETSGWVAFRWRAVTISISAEMPFRRRNYDFGGVSPITAHPFVYFCIE